MLNDAISIIMEFNKKNGSVVLIIPIFLALTGQVSNSSRISANRATIDTTPSVQAAFLAAAEEANSTLLTAINARLDSYEKSADAEIRQIRAESNNAMEDFKRVEDSIAGFEAYLAGFGPSIETLISKQLDVYCARRGWKKRKSIDQLRSPDNKNVNDIIKWAKWGSGEGIYYSEECGLDIIYADERDGDFARKKLSKLVGELGAIRSPILKKGGLVDASE